MSRHGTTPATVYLDDSYSVEVDVGPVDEDFFQIFQGLEADYLIFPCPDDEGSVLIPVSRIKYIHFHELNYEV